MWRLIKDDNLIDIYIREFIDCNVPQAIVNLLDDLRNHEFPDELYVTTSLGQLRLTTAPDYLQDKKHDAVGVIDYGYEYVVAYIEAGSNYASASRICKEKELYDVVQCYLIRLFLQK